MYILGKLFKPNDSLLYVYSADEAALVSGSEEEQGYRTSVGGAWNWYAIIYVLTLHINSFMPKNI